MILEGQAQARLHLKSNPSWSNERGPVHFDEQFTALDGPLLRHCLKETDLEGEWPEQYSKAILPFSLFDSDLVFGRSGRNKNKERGLLQLDPPPQFDLVIVDEAHHLRNSETFLHQGVRYFCDHAKAVVLLTATPVQLGSEDLFTLLNVLRPDFVIDHASFAQMAEPNRYINEAVRHCRMAKPGWEQDARTSLAEVARTEWPVRLRGTENRHKGFQKSPSEVGLRRGLRPPFATVSGRAKSYRPRKLICRQISGERWAISAVSLLTP